MTDEPTIFARLTDVIESRKGTPVPSSYTQKLLAGGVDLIGAKLCEEAAEVVEAARLEGKERRNAVVHETADLMYHLLVMLACCGVTLADVELELARRFGTSGLAEKASRVTRRKAAGGQGSTEQ
jgi:phosphoribosyl-ATP pyrophosphohydrolase